ncbi:MAG: metallophosphoesterase [Alphaproteobacteria bacterium]|nr:MAG: metallophosphoesterase [Alphaproteobacteria bacterium]
MFRIAHISDLHLAPLPPLRLHELMSKRIWGRLHWMLRRRHVHRPQVLDALRADLARQQPDHLCITGDLTNLALPAEFDCARDWIAGLGLSEERLSVIPGNHDAYVPGALTRGMPVWQRWMRDDEGRVGFPFLHRRGPVAIVGLSSAHATPPGFAAGWLDRAQMARLTTLLEDLQQRDAARILLIHHPPQESDAPARSALWGRRRLQALLHRHPVDLVLHGHAHRPLAAMLGDRNGPIPVRGAGSASRDAADGNPAHYQLIGIDRPGGGGKWRIEIRHRRYDRDRGGFVNAGAESIGAP